MRLTTKLQLVFAVALVAFVSLGAGGVRANTASRATMKDSSPDVMFIDMMIMHHQQGIEMARMAEQKASMDRLKEFARKTITDQEQDIAKLQELRNRFFANAPKTDQMMMGGKMMTMPQMQRMMEMDMNKLRAASGSEFDRVFLATMTKHHQMAIRMSRDELKRGRQAEVKAMAQETIDKQTKEIGEMREMRRSVGGTQSKRSRA